MPVVPSRFRLGIDTATAWLALAVWSPADGVVHRDEALLDRRLAAAVLPRLDAFLTRHDVARASLEAIGVGTGPGSFTGIRVGVAVALALGRGLGVPVAGGDTLAALALRGLADGESGWVVIDARRSHVYAARYSRRGDRVQPLEAPRRLPRTAIPQGETVIEGVAPDAVHHARVSDAGAPPTPRYV
jgi:tRNA threonylcarbamoyladenosine biosynthesis protein TsaB